MKKYLLFILTVFIINFVVAQTHNVPSSGNNTWTTCNGHLYDCGGANSNYVNSCNGYTVIYPATTGALIRVQGTYSTESNWDYIYIYDGEGTTGTLLVTLTGTGITETLTSTTGPITVRFYSDGSGCSYSGFDLTVSCYIPMSEEVPNTGNNSITTCEGFLYDDGGLEENYSNNCNGYTTIYPDIAGNFVSLSGTYDVENNNDFIYIYNGEDTNAPLLATLTGMGILPQTIATNGALTVQFVSNASTTNTGFSFNIACIDPTVHNVPSTSNDIWITCNGHIYDVGGPTGNYINNCNGYTVIYPATPNANLTIQGSYIGEGCCDHLYIYDGVGIGGTQLCDIISPSGGTSVNVGPFTSTSGVLTVRFTSDGSSAYQGFDLFVHCENPCPPSSPTVTAPSGSSVCMGETIILVASSNYQDATYHWYDQATMETEIGTGTEFSIIGNEAGEYTYYVATSIVGLTGNDCYSQPVPATITVNTIPTPEVAVENEIVCLEGQANFYIVSPQPNVEYNWYNVATGGTILNTGTTYSATPISQGTHTYYVEAIEVIDGVGNCHSSRIPISFSVSPQVHINFTPNLPTITCSTNNREVTATAVGGSNSFSYTWGSGPNPNSATNTFNSEGTYYITVTDINYGCLTSDSIVITTDTVYPVISIENYSGTTEITCATPDIQVLAVGSDIYSWSNGTNTAYATITTGGTHFVTATNAVNGCQGTASIEITTDTVKPQIEITSNTGGFDLNCNAHSITVVATSNVSCTYQWNTGNSPYLAMNTFYNPGTYTVTVTNPINACSNTANVIITLSPELSSNLHIINTIKCNGDLATVLVEAEGGKAPYTGTGVFEVPAGNHFFTIIDANNCESTTAITFTEPPKLNIEIINSENIKCHGDSNASLTANVSGGIEPYLYHWSNSNNTIDSYLSKIDNLGADTYNVTISDQSNCSITKQIQIEQPSEFLMNFISQDISCYGQNNGKLNIIATGGVKPYKYQVTGNNKIQNFSAYTNLEPGSYSIFVSDSNNCSLSGNFVIQEPQKLNVQHTTQRTSCEEASDGEITVSVTGGLPPYSIKTNDRILENTTINNLSAGNYEVIVSDNNNCFEILNNITIKTNNTSCLLIPNAFTPNGDNFNDTWVIEGLEYFKDFSIEVFNIWGQLLYKSKNYSSPDWDGKYKNKLVVSGTYLYVITADGKNFSGSLQVIY